MALADVAEESCCGIRIVIILSAENPQNGQESAGVKNTSITTELLSLHGSPIEGQVTAFTEVIGLLLVETS